MRYSLEINGYQIGPFIAEDGVSITKEKRNEKTVTVMSGRKYTNKKEAHQISVNLLDMPDSYYHTISEHIRIHNPAIVNYTDFDEGVTINNVLFYVNDLQHQASSVVGEITYLKGITFSLDERL